MDEPSKGTLVAVRERRDQVIAVLSDHFADDTLALDEFEERVSRAHQANSLQELDSLVTDLVPVSTSSNTPVKTAPQVPVPAPQASTALQVSRPKSRHVFAVMGGIVRKGQWVVPAETKVTTIMGGASLDFREAVLPPGVTEIKVRAVFGGVEIIVPPHMAVETEGSAIMGGFEEMNRVPSVPDPDRPLLRISGLALFGGVAVTTRLPGESELDAHRRERKERKKQRELGEGKRKALKDGS